MRERGAIADARSCTSLAQLRIAMVLLRGRDLDRHGPSVGDAVADADHNRHIVTGDAAGYREIDLVFAG